MKKYSGFLILILCLLMTPCLQVSAYALDEYTNSTSSHTGIFDTSATYTPSNDASILSTRSSYAYVKTPNGSDVLALQKNISPTNEEIANADAEMQGWYPNAVQVHSANPNYNCHSYAWYSQSTENPYWIDSPNMYYSEEDKSYAEVSGDPRTGDIVCYYNVYGDNIHSGIINDVTMDDELNDQGYSEISIMVQSKFGGYGVYIHSLVECPYTIYAHNYLQLNEESRKKNIAVSVKFYRPRVESAHQLNGEMDDLTLTKSISSSNGIENTYSMYELNVGLKDYYKFTVSSDSAMDIVLYDERMQQYCTLNYTETSNIYTFALNLPCGRYYLRCEYTDGSHSGTISVGIKYHDDHVYNYTSVDTTYHTGECIYCGHETGNAIHRWRDYSLTHVVCEDCGLLKRLPDSGFIPIIKGIELETETE